jgi:hypothetical protein
MSDQFFHLHRRIDNALEILGTKSDPQMRNKALFEMKTALDELDDLLGLDELLTEHAEAHLRTYQPHAQQ